MNIRRLGILGAFIGLVLLLAACSGTASESTTSTFGSANGVSSPTSSNTTSALGSPAAKDQAGLFASPSASPTAQPIDLATALQNLQNQNSYVMTAKLTNVEGTFANVPGVTTQSTLKVERSGQDQHLAVTSNDGKTVFEVWQVNGDVWVNIGAGPVKVAKNNSIVSQFVATLGADRQIMKSMESEQANYQVTGTDLVNGKRTTVETAQYRASKSADNKLFAHSENATITSKIWVAQDGNYLVRGQFTISGNAGATPAAGTTSIGTPSASGGAQVTVTVTQVGEVQSIQPPS